MKKIINTLLGVALMCGLAMNAQERIVLTKNDVNLRSNPSPTASVVTKGKKGTILNLIEAKPGWYLVMLDNYESPMWVASSVSAKVPEWAGENMAQSLISMEEYPNSYTATERLKNGETIYTWSITASPKAMENLTPGAEVKAVYSQMAVYNTGRSFTQESFYQGVFMGDFILLEKESSDFGETYTPMENNIYLYPTAGNTSESGLYFDGHFFRDGDAM